MPERSGADLFGTYLEAFQRYSAAQPKRPGGDWLLSRLKESGAEPVPDLMAGSQMSLFDFTAMLTNLQEAGLVSLEGEPGQERVVLTPAGKMATDPAP